MSYADCISAIKDAAGEILSDDDVDALVSEVQKRYNWRKALGTLDDDRKILGEIAKEIADEERLAALVEKRARAINIIRRQQREDFFSRFEGREDTALSALNVGREGKGAGLGASVAAQQRGLRADLMGPMVAELRAGNLLDLIGRRNPEIEREIARNMWAITEAEVSGQAAVLTGRKESQDAARIFAKYQEIARQIQNDAGAFIGRAPGYIVRQSHDMFRLRRAGAQTWIDTILPRLDDSTFANLDRDTVEARRDFLLTIWNELASGEHYRDRGADDVLAGFKGPGSLAKRLSQHRVLHFKSADDWLAYNDSFGMGGLIEGLIHGLNKAADNAALMRTWGTNPEAAFNAAVDRLAEKAARRGDIDRPKKLRGWRIKAEFDQITGASKIPGNPTWAQWGAGTRAVLNMASLGGIVLSSIPDNAIRAAVLKHHGIGFFEGHMDGLADLTRGRSSGEKRAIADHLGAGLDGLLGNLAARWSAEDTVPGKVARAQNLFFRLNLMSWWTDAKSTGAGLVMAHNLARNASRDFAALDPLLQTTLRRYGLGPDQWAVLRQAEMKLGGDTPYLMPEAVDQIPDEIVRPLASGSGDRALERARTDLRLALRTFYAEEIANVNSFGGARERAIATGWAGQPGTPHGEAIRFIMQFKMFPITYATRHLAREFSRGGMPGMVHMILATWALGYVSMQAKELAKGREPRAFSAKTLLAAAQQGGGLGIYGDFLFGDFNRFGGGIVETLAGPAVGKASQVFRAFAELREGEAGDAAAMLMRTSVSTIPGVNLFYTKAALDYLILYQLSEWSNPGYLRRMESRMQRENGQRFVIPPSSAIPYGGGDRFLEGVR